MSETATPYIGPRGPLPLLSAPTQPAGDLTTLGLPPEKAKIMIVDDGPLDTAMLELQLAEAGFSAIQSVTDPKATFDMIRSEQPDVLLLDIVMPEVDGFEILAAVQQSQILAPLPVIILTASTTAETKLKALELGATDFLSKPVDPSELLLRLRNTLATKAFQDHLKNQSAELEREVQRRTRELERARKEAMFCLARAAEFRDDDTGRHVLRVGRYAGLIAAQLGFSKEAVEMLEQAAQLHDVGKIGISDTILLKAGKLDPSEFELMKQHCDFGKKIIEPMSDEEWKIVQRHTDVGSTIMEISSSPVMKMAGVIAQTHHEKWNGTGYPHGLAGEDIPIEGRITAVADVYDALSSPRSYKEPFPLEKCLTIMEEGRGQHFDPRVLDAFYACLESVRKVQAEWADPAN